MAEDGSPRKIIHVDMDAFFASVEQRDHPALRGKPVAVGGGGPRGVVAAASYEARAFGVRSAMPSITAKRLCPDLLFVRHRFEVYKQVSQQIRDIFLSYTDLVEPLSLDEAYLDVTENKRGIQNATEMAREIKERIRDETQLTASAGVSYNKFLAKIASDYKKPDGLFVIKPHQGEAFVASLPIERFFGVGKVTARRMNDLGIFTGADLRAQPEAVLRTHFGKAGGFYYRMARGIDHRVVCPDRIRKSISSETTFSEDLYTWEALSAKLLTQTEDVWRFVERSRIHGRTVTLKLKFQDFQIISRSKSVVWPISAREQFEQIALNLLWNFLPPPKGIRLIGIGLSNLDTEDHLAGKQLMLPFENGGLIEPTNPHM
ncbi:MAG: DNA polymerase IV [Bacteroidetes Order II. Incertae sedis bacterium]|nr:DNA polymerase IV [Bacteroidetes Order II. bacterium]